MKEKLKYYIEKGRYDAWEKQRLGAGARAGAGARMSPEEPWGACVNRS